MNLRPSGYESCLVTFFAGLLPALIFWCLDAYYLRQERQYRALYDHVRQGDISPDDCFTLDASPFSQITPSWFRTLAAPSVAWFHLAILIVVLGVFAFFSFWACDGT